MKANKLTGGALLIAGTCIGAGMLALPITLGRSGIYYSSLLLILSWLCTYLSGLYVLEANMCLQEDSNYISMAQRLLGPLGKTTAWLTYLMLLYSLMAAYLTGGGGIVRDFLHITTGISVYNFISPLPWIAVVSAFLYLGTKWIDGFNRILIFGLLVTYVILVWASVPHAKSVNITRGETGFVLAALPVLSTAFGYHVIIPSLRTYFKSDSKLLTRTILLGSAIPLVIYLVWNFVVFGTIPLTGPNSLTHIYNMGGQPALLTNTMAALLNSPWLVWVAEAFIFFAIASSFVGISLSLFDFLSDGFGIKKTTMGKIIVAMITFVPPLLYALFYPHGFVLALGYAGVFVAILHGILPSLMVRSARKENLSSAYRAPGGRFGIFLILLLSTLVIAAQVLVNTHLVHAY